MKLRIARATQDLEIISLMYERGLGLSRLGSFEDHDGIDGVMLGNAGLDFHLEFTHDRKNQLVLSRSPEDLLVFYVTEMEFHKLEISLEVAGFKKVKSINPYWDEHGSAFEDFESNRVVLCRKSWPITN